LINTRRANDGSALSNLPPSSRRREDLGMAVRGEGPATRPAPGGPHGRFGSDLKPRVVAAAVMGSLALATAWIGGFGFALFWWLASIVLLWEWQRLVGGARLSERVAVGALVVALAALFALNNSFLGVSAVLVLGAVALGWLAGPREGGWAAAGALYAGALVASLVLLRLSPSFGRPAILWLFAVVWGADIAAYFAGRLIGGPRLWPSVSPGKTWAGAIAGALMGAVLGLMLVAWTNRLAALFWLGLVTAIVSELGDLFESALKRRFGVKDSSGLIPGHGGLMDRLDAFVAASVFAAAVAGLNSRGPFIAGGLFKW
jgi:phosphatidate cytidylyltransferase